MPELHALDVLDNCHEEIMVDVENTCSSIGSLCEGTLLSYDVVENEAPCYGTYATAAQKRKAVYTVQEQMSS